MFGALGNVIEKTRKGGLLDLFQLLLHFADIGGQFKLQAIVEVDFVSWIDATQIDVVAHLFTQGSKGLLPNFGHQEQGRANIEAMAFTHNLVCAPTGGFVLFEHGHTVSVFR